MASYARPNHQSMPSSHPSPASRLSPFPPAPKNVRIVSVFGEPQRSPTADSRAIPKPTGSHNVSWALWLIAITAFLGLVAIVIACSQGWNHLGN